MTSDADLLAALEHGAPDLPRTMPPGAEAIAAAGVWGDYGSVLVLRRGDEDDGFLLTDVYLMRRGRPPDSCSGSGVPDRVLTRPDTHLTSLGAQLAAIDGHWFAELTVIAGRDIATVRVAFGGRAVTVAVPPSGLITLPGLITGVTDRAEFAGFDAAGTVRAVEHYLPLTEDDRKSGWPEAAMEMPAGAP